MLQARQLLGSRSLTGASFLGTTQSQSLLREVTAMAHNIQTSSPEEVRAAIDTANAALQSILPDLQSAHNRARDQLNLQHGEIDACSRNMESGHADTLASQRQLKDQCVQDTANAAQRTLDECDNGWHAHVTALASRLPDCGATQPDAFHSMVAAWRSFVQDEWSIIDSEKIECDQATADEAALQPVCQERTSDFEGTFCRHRLMCSLTTACRAHEVEVFNSMRPGFEEDMASRHQQFQTVTQVGCILDLVHDAMGTNISIPEASMNACGDDLDLTPLTLTFPTMPESALSVCQDPHSGELSCPDVDELEHPTSWTDGQADNIAPNTFEYLVVAGGGGGGSGGGGAGGVKQGTMTAAFTGTITVEVGAGGSHGSGGAGTSRVGTNGGNSAINTPEAIITHGGGHGGDPSTESGAEGGSGGGGRYDRQNVARTSGISGEGHGGGRSNQGSYGAGGGGGGAGGRGQDAPRQHYAGNGGVGVTSDVGCEAGLWFGGGGGGGVNANDNSNGDGNRGGIGGNGGGGRGSTHGGGGGNMEFTGTDGDRNTGGGGGGTDPESSVAGNGGSGIVKIKYEGSQFYEGGEVESCNGFTVHTFSTPGVHNLRAPSVSPAPAPAGPLVTCSSLMGSEDCFPTVQLADGIFPWSDRSYTLTSIAPELLGAVVYQNPVRTYAPGMLFRTNQPVTLYLWNERNRNGGFPNLGWERSTQCVRWAGQPELDCWKREVSEDTEVAVSGHVVGGMFAVPL